MIIMKYRLYKFSPTEGVWKCIDTFYTIGEARKFVLRQRGDGYLRTTLFLADRDSIIVMYKYV